MNPDVKKKWLEALRSGEYKQGKEALRLPDNTFCCLGVLCDLHAKETGNQWLPVDGDMEYLGGTCVVPDEVMQWAGLPEEDPLVGGLTDQDKKYISCLNDELDYTFSEIADVIEESL